MTALLALLVVSCAGGQAPSPTPTQTPPTPTAPAAAQPRPQTPATTTQEVLAPGSPDSLFSNPEPDKAVNILFVLDASGSMLETIGNKSKVEIAKQVMASLVEKLPPSINLALYAYGHRTPNSDKTRSCQDIQSLAPLGQDNAKSFIQQLSTIRASGWTPLAKSLDLASQALPTTDTSINNVVLLSDGQETCDGKPIETAQKLKDGPTRLTIHTVGLAIDENTRKELQEVASVSGGTYNEADDAQSLLSAMQKALIAARSGTFLRAEITGEEGRRVSTSVWLTDPQSKEKLHEFRSWLDSPIPPGSYDILVGTAPRVIFQKVQIQAHTRTAIKLSAGALRVETADPQGAPLKALAHLLDPATGSTLRSFPTWYNQPALPGSYDLLIEANPTLTKRHISISPQKLTILALGQGTLRLDVTSLGGAKPNWEAQLQDADSGDTLYRSLVGRELPVMSGNYQLVILSQPEIRQQFKISPGEAKVIRLETGLLRIELLDAKGQRSKTQASLSDASQKQTGRFSTWEDVSPLPGTYQLTIDSQPPIQRQIQVSPTDPTILKLRSP